MPADNFACYIPELTLIELIKQSRYFDGLIFSAALKQLSFFGRHPEKHVVESSNHKSMWLSFLVIKYFLSFPQIDCVIPGVIPLPLPPLPFPYI